MLFVIALPSNGRAELTNQSLDDVAMHIGQTVITALESVGQPLVIDAQQMKQRRVQIVDVHSVLDDIEREGVRFTVDRAWSDSATSHPNGKASSMVVTPVIGVSQVSLAIGCPAKLATPHNERVFEQASLPQVAD